MLFYLFHIQKVQRQDLEARSQAFSNMLDKMNKEHRSEVKKLKNELENSETKHAAYTDALVAQMKEHLLGAVTKCKQYAKDLTAKT
jgi:Skp family chaperone for outer membrane proteins